VPIFKFSLGGNLQGEYFHGLISCIRDAGAVLASVCCPDKRESWHGGADRHVVRTVFISTIRTSLSRHHQTNSIKVRA